MHCPSRKGNSYFVLLPTQLDKYPSRARVDMRIPSVVVLCICTIKAAQGQGILQIRAMLQQGCAEIGS